MTYFFGKSGADAIFKALSRVCLVLNKYHAKCDVAIDLAASSSLITSDQAAAAHAFVDTAKDVCDIFKIVAGNSGF